LPGITKKVRAKPRLEEMRCPSSAFQSVAEALMAKFTWVIAHSSGTRARGSFLARRRVSATAYRQPRRPAIPLPEAVKRALPRLSWVMLQSWAPAGGGEYVFSWRKGPAE